MRYCPTAWWVTLLTAVAVIAGCGTAADSRSSDNRPSVVAAAYPYFFLVQRIGDPHVRATNLTSPGAEPHDLELTPRQVAEVHAAGLVVYQRGFQPALDDVLAQGKPEHVVEVGSLVGTAGSGAAGGSSSADPHAWLDPTKFSVVASAVGDALASLDPGHAEDYDKNTKDLATRLAGLDKEYRQGLSGCGSQTIVTNHSAFGHLTARYGLTQVSLSGLAPEAEPSAAHMAALARLIRKRNVRTVFVEPLASPQAAEALASDVGAKTAILDPLEGLTDRNPNADYFSVMRANLVALREALSCP